VIVSKILTQNIFQGMRYVNKAIRLILTKFERFYYRIGNRKKCYVCQRTFRRFTKYQGGFIKMPKIVEMLKIIGSDPDNFGCAYCSAYDRERHLFMYFDKLDLWNKMKGAKILHFSPENNLAKKITSQNPEEYVKANFNPRDESIKKIDLTDVPYSDSTFDFLIANHILEHIPEYKLAMREIFRVLKNGGAAILQTPFSKLIETNFEVKNIDSNATRTFLYGQFDHLRVFSERHFFQDLKDAGFELQIKKNSELFTEQDCIYYGVNSNEDLIMVIKN